MIPYKWKFWKKWHKKPERLEPAQLTLEVAIEGYEKFIEQLAEMEKAVESFGAAASRASEYLNDACERFVVTYNINKTA